MTDKKIKSIVKILIENLHPYKLILFGSRGKGKASFNSDYDIAVESKQISLSEKRELREKIDEVIGLHKIDLVFLKEVDGDFRSLIKKTGKVIYEK